jgi:hypothetical protein
VKRFIGRLFMGAVRALSLGWALMLMFGALHGEVSDQVPAIGYWPSVWLAFLAGWIVGALAGEATSDVVQALEFEEALE